MVIISINEHGGRMDKELEKSAGYSTDLVIRFEIRNSFGISSTGHFL